MSDLNDTKFNSGSSPADLENDVTNSRRDFLKKTGKFAIYTPPGDDDADESQRKCND